MVLTFQRTFGAPRSSTIYIVENVIGRLQLTDCRVPLITRSQTSFSYNGIWRLVFWNRVIVVTPVVVVAVIIIIIISSNYNKNNNYSNVVRNIGMVVQR